MKIEITKKHIIVASVSIAIVALSFTGGYFVGVNSKQNPKGNSDNFFVKEIPTAKDNASSNLIYHSSPNCPAIRYGIEMDK